MQRDDAPLDSRFEGLGDLFAGVVNSMDAPILVWRLDADADPGGMRLVYANPAASAGFGMPLHDAIGRPLREVLVGVGEETDLEAFAAVAAGAPARSLGEISYDDDRIGGRAYAVRLIPMGDRMVAVEGRDITLKRRVETQLTQTLDSMNDAFYSLDRDWRYVFVNAEGERVIGRLREELIGRNMWEMFPQLETHEAGEVFRRVARDRVASSMDRFVAWTGRILTLKLYPTPDGIAVFAQDITERELLEEQVRRSQKMDAMSALAGGIAHDFNNSLTAIRTATELALGSVTDAQVRDDLQRIEVVAEHAAALTQQLLTISRSQPARVEPTDLNLVIVESNDLLDQLLGDEVDLVLDTEDGLDPVLVDRSQIQQIILNFTINARDAMPEGGVLTIRTRNAVVDGGQAALDAECDPGRYVMLEVSDTGIGMDDEVRRSAFDPFFSTKPEGTGLGLASVYSIVLQAGASIEVTTAPGQGTSFRIMFKVTERPLSVDAPPQAAPSMATSLVGRTILVVEDDEHVRPLVVRVLTRLGCRTLEAGNAAEAIEVAAIAEGEIDLLLTDVVMPGMSGGELAVALLADRPSMKVLFMSGHAVDTLVRRGVQDETADFVRKPFRSMDLAEKVRTSLRA